MRALKLLIVLIIYSGLSGCDKKEDNVLISINVERYVELLKANRYDSINLPAFTYQDIPALLVYRNETQIIHNFPRNGISSFYSPDCKLGMYVLWTIESIRAVAAQNKPMIYRFPSQNAILELRDSGEMQLVNDNTSHEIAARAYFDWWENNKGKEFTAFMNIDPLASTIYKWH